MPFSYAGPSFPVVVSVEFCLQVIMQLRCELCPRIDLGLSHSVGAFSLIS